MVRRSKRVAAASPKDNKANKKGDRRAGKKKKATLVMAVATGIVKEDDGVDVTVQDAMKGSDGGDVMPKQVALNDGDNDDNDGNNDGNNNGNNDGNDNGNDNGDNNDNDGNTEDGNDDNAIVDDDEGDDDDTNEAELYKAIDNIIDNTVADEFDGSTDEAEETVAEDEDDSAEVLQKASHDNERTERVAIRRRGRPRKLKIDNNEIVKKRGRPRKL